MDFIIGIEQYTETEIQEINPTRKIEIIYITVWYTKCQRMNCLHKIQLHSNTKQLAEDNILIKQK